VLALIIGHEMGYAPTDQEELGIGALLHDVGYLRLPRNLYRRKHELGAHERSLLQQHPQLAETVTAGARGGTVSETAQRIIVQHHERLDGSGYPQGLSGNALLGFSQLVGLVDTYDGMVSWRTEQVAMLPNDAIRQLFVLGEKGCFDKALVETTIKVLGVYPIGSLIRLNTGEKALVIGIHAEHRLKPVVKIIAGPHGEPYGEPLTVDLAVVEPGRPVRTILRALDPRHEQVRVSDYFDPACEGTPR
ncbi:MAG TPA: HD domain-containing phosphohydrolase, partial [Nitrospiraceae bacterium]|nr:HD domain-containing phosphohydrolase [Nitrospiraceae bacterium]